MSRLRNFYSLADNSTWLHDSSQPLIVEQNFKKIPKCSTTRILRLCDSVSRETAKIVLRKNNRGRYRR